MFAIGDEVRRDVSAVKLHTFNVFGFEFQTLGFLDGDHTILAYFIHHIRNQVADF